MSASQQKALNRLADDTRRFLNDHGLPQSFLGVLKLVLVVEYWAILHFRLCEYSKEIPSLIGFPLNLVVVFAKPFVEGMTSSRLRHGAIIGGGLLLHHSMGVAIAVGAEIGENCTIFSGVVVANKGNGRGQGTPKIGNNVTLMVGCKLLGNIVVGDGAIIGANAVVLSDVPKGATAVGIPARIIQRAD